MLVDKIIDKGAREGEELLALILHPDDDFHPPFTAFHTRPDEPLQVGSIHLSAGSKIQPHVHRPIHRETTQTQEFILVQRGKVRVSFFTQDKDLVDIRVLEKGDMLLLLRGGHGFDVSEDCELVEVKNGPYLGVDQDKERFSEPGAG